ncbi:MAG: hypothetical protein J6A75_02340 [Lachnospiraceae bacterium]|nr:hypothetical protein [Lachnospiraceae bacterium]
MRILLLLRGNTKQDKSSWFKQQEVKKYMLSLDSVRILCQSPIMQIDGSVCTSFRNENIVWKIFLEILEERMKNGEFTIIDGRIFELSKVNICKEMCIKYRYKMHCVDTYDKAEKFLKTTEKNCYQIHGHRNTKKLPVRVNDRVFNLEGKVEFGGALRCVQVDKEGIHIVEVKNEVLYQ